MKRSRALSYTDGFVNGANARGKDHVEHAEIEGVMNVRENPRRSKDSNHYRLSS